LSRAGRKRKWVNRQPNGQPHREPSDSPRLVAAGMLHRRGLAELDQVDQRAESMLGRMRLRNQISETQFLAGQRFAKVVGAYLATIAPPGSLAGRGRGFDCPGTHPCPDCICAHRRAVYMAAHDHLAAMVGHRGVVAVKTVVINNLSCPFDLWQPLGWGLSALSHHFGIGRN
jgi:hypothetical protein